MNRPFRFQNLPGLLSDLASPRILHAITLLLFVALMMSVSIVRATESFPRHEDVATLDGLMKAYYDVVSGPAHTPRNTERDLSLHHAGAQLVAPDRDEKGQWVLRRLGVREFHEWSKPVYEPGFYEREIHREVQTYGRLSHVWSTYETRETPDGPVVARGINSIQVYYDGDRYWILAETWDSESASNPLPAQYLP